MSQHVKAHKDIVRLWAAALVVLAAGLAVAVLSPDAWAKAATAVAFLAVGAASAIWAAAIAIHGRRQP